MDFKSAEEHSLSSGQGIMNNISLRNLSVIIFLLLLIFASAFTYSTIKLSRNISQIETAWTEYKSQKDEKARLNNSLYGALGYGGMIHNYKHFILRKDFKTFVKFERSMGAVQGLVNQYAALSSSAAERLALNDIQTMLDAYQDSVDFISKEIEKGSLSAKIDPQVQVDDALALRGLKVLLNEVTAAHGYFKDENNKPVLAATIRSELGYGGMIHAFNNYILRKDVQYKDSALASIKRIDAAINKYFNLSVSVSEKTALEDIVASVEKYKLSLTTVDQLIEQNLTSEAIDAEIRIDDSYALRGLETLDQDNINQIDQKSAELSLLLEDVSRRERVNSLVVICSTVVIAFFIFLIFSRKIIKPVQNMSKVMWEMAHGNLDAYTDILEKNSVLDNTELGNMEASLRVFKNNEIKRRAAEDEISVLALTDPLTGLANRNQFDKKYNEMTALGKREENSLILLAVDLDDFKPINDVYGHAAGDLILKSVAKKLLLTFRETDLVARLGGDEFSVIMYGTDDIKGVIKTVQRLIKAVHLPIPFGKDMLSVGLSVGIALQPYDSEDDMELLMQNADKALYKAKALGKNTFFVYTPEDVEPIL